jgi:hypothetical protein
VAFKTQAINSRDVLLGKIKADAGPGDCVLLMGARDPSLPVLAKKIVELFGGEMITQK